MNDKIIPPNTNLAKGTNYKLEISNLPGTVFWVTTCNIPSITVNETTVAHPMHGNAYVPSTTQTYSPFTVTFLVNENYDNYMELYNWFQAQAGKFEDRKPESELMVDATLHILTNNKNASTIKFTFHDLFPTNIGDLAFNNESAEPILTDASFQFTYMTMEKTPN